MLGFPDEIARKYGKIADLAFGFGGRVAAYRNFAPVNDTATDERILAFSNAWRDKHKQTYRFWYEIGDAALLAFDRAPTPISCRQFTLRCEPLHNIPFLFIRLPSGRDIGYPFVKRIINNKGYPALTYMDNAEGLWLEYRPDRGIWGGTFTNHITQAFARDHLAAAMLRIEAAGFPIVLHRHDSICCEVPDDRKDI
jgi:DNA polymerase